MKQVIKVEFIHAKIPEIVIDEDGVIWRLPFQGEGRFIKLKRLEPFYERNYVAYRIRGRVYPESFLLKHRIKKRYILEVEEPKKNGRK